MFDINKLLMCLKILNFTSCSIPGAVEYTNYIFADGLDLLLIEYPGYETKPSGGEALVMLELWGTQSNLSLPLLPSPLRPGVVASDIYGSNRTISHLNQVQMNDLC